MNSNRDKGHRLEREISKRMRQLGFNATTSRYSSKEKDENKVDLCGTEPFNLQCKSHNVFKNPIDILKSMPKDGNYNVVIEKVKRKGVFAIMDLEDFLALVEILKTEKII